MPTSPFPSGIPELDACLPGGLSRGSLALLAGASESGKTALAVRLALELARQGRRTLYLTLKDSGLEISSRLAAQVWELTPEEARWRLAAEASEALAELGVIVADLGGTAPALAQPSVADGGRLAAELEAEVLVLDDLGALDGAGRERQQELAALRRLASDEQLLVVVLDDGGGRYLPGMPAPESGLPQADLRLFTSRPGHLAGWPSGQSESLRGLVALELERSGERAVTSLVLEGALIR